MVQHQDRDRRDRDDGRVTLSFGQYHAGLLRKVKVEADRERLLAELVGLAHVLQLHIVEVGVFLEPVDDAQDGFLVQRLAGERSLAGVVQRERRDPQSVVAVDRQRELRRQSSIGGRVSK